MPSVFGQKWKQLDLKIRKQSLQILNEFGKELTRAVHSTSFSSNFIEMSSNNFFFLRSSSFVLAQELWICCSWINSLEILSHSSLACMSSPSWCCVVPLALDCAERRIKSWRVSLVLRIESAVISSFSICILATQINQRGQGQILCFVRISIIMCFLLMQSFSFLVILREPNDHTTTCNKKHLNDSVPDEKI